MGGRHRLEQRVLAAGIHAVGEQDESLSPLLLGHQLIGGQLDGIVHIGPAAPASAARVAAAAPRVPAAASGVSAARVSTARIPAAGISAAGISTAAALSLSLLLLLLGALGDLKLVESRLQILARGGEILGQQLDFEIEVDDEGQVAVFPQNLVEEFEAGGALVVEHGALAAARIHQQAQG